MTKEKPILFNAEMVRAILDGRKTQTRRVVKPQPVKKDGFYTLFGAQWGGEYSVPCVYGHSLSTRNPYGQVGDHLWVRETWTDLTKTHGAKWEKYNEATNLYERGQHQFIWYRADGDQPCLGDGRVNQERWKPSIFMPREFSRITLEITEIRVERLQDISRGDAMAEGCPFPNMADGKNPVNWFSELWDSINGKKHPWSSNPWVWAVKFKRIKP